MIPRRDEYAGVLTGRDLKPANILCSGLETGRVTSKVGDLGLGKQQSLMQNLTIEENNFVNTRRVLIVFPSGRRINVQPFAMRAPEVFLGKACTGPSQVWAIAAMVLC